MDISCLKFEKMDVKTDFCLVIFQKYYAKNYKRAPNKNERPKRTNAQKQPSHSEASKKWPPVHFHSLCVHKGLLLTASEVFCRNIQKFNTYAHSRSRGRAVVLFGRNK